MNKSNFRKCGIIITLIIVAFSFQSCLVSRCQRPQIMGYIYDETTHTPIENCKVGESLTNAIGYFNLKEIRYSQFTFVGYEAPPLHVNEAIYKEGYEKKSIDLHNPFGGGMRKGAVHNADTIYLKKVSIQVSK
ncbi:hypothetical protein B0A62_16010 [Flavobacterium hydatis]|uniref:Lipoprotein n=2 Tax=Flavobacterium hydatis TaxID=991 RepID=A0A086AEP1_FLAHY|nr:hypothetical protein IW20_15980 [Flavobacterium hydatis]OXA91907.1 hypothetical protein B0A62_16010 [Flavobacterium hydatis]